MELATSQSRLNDFLSSKADGTFYVGHATVLVRMERKLFLIDSVDPRPLFLESWLFFPELVMDDRFLSVDGVFISHCHEDHYDTTYLRKLKPGTPIYITGERIGFDEIKNDSQYNVVEVPPFELFKIDDKIQVLAMPSDHNNFDSSFILKCSSFSVFQGNDNFLPESSVQRARDLAGPVDHAYIPFSYVWWYPFVLTSMPEADRRREIMRLTELNMEIGAMMGRVLDAQIIIPSAGNLVFYESIESPINNEIALPFDFVEFAEKKHPELARRTFALLSGDYVLKDSGTNHIVSAGENRAGFMKRLDKFLAVMSEKITPAAKRPKLEAGLGKFLSEKVAGKDLPPHELDLYFFRRDLPTQALHLDMRNYKVDVVDKPERHDRSISFSIQDHAFEMWVNGEISFETLLNSQRLLIHRNPEVFERPVWDVIRSHF